MTPSDVAKALNKASRGVPLLSLPTDVISLIAEYLPSRSIGRLCASGDAHMTRLLLSNHVVTSVDLFGAIPPNPQANILLRFPSLRHVTIHDSSSRVPFDVSLLPVALESISFVGVALLPRFSTNPIGEPCRFPNLRSLRLDLDSSSASPEALVASLSQETLTSLKVLAAPDWLRALANLELPSSLETLFLEENCPVTPQNLQNLVQTSFPESLKILKLGVFWGWSVSSFPPNLTDLEMPADRMRRRINNWNLQSRIEALKRMPKTLQTLTWYCKFTDDLCPVLPPALTRLVGASNYFDNATTAIAALPQTLTSWPELSFEECPPSLPPLLKELSLTAGIKLHTASIPPALTSLRVIDTHLKNIEVFRLLPSTLTSLEMNIIWNKKSEELLLALPRSLRSLTTNISEPLTSSLGLPLGLEHLHILGTATSSFFNDLPKLTKLQWLRVEAPREMINLGLLPSSITAARLTGLCVLDSRSIRNLPPCLITLIIRAPEASTFIAQDLAFLPSSTRYLYLPKIAKPLSLKAVAKYAPVSVLSLHTHYEGRPIVYTKPSLDLCSPNSADYMWRDFEDSN